MSVRRLALILLLLELGAGVPLSGTALAEPKDLDELLGEDWEPFSVILGEVSWTDTLGQVKTEEGYSVFLRRKGQIAVCGLVPKFVFSTIKNCKFWGPGN